MACGCPWHARDYWARFERFVKQLTQQCEDVYVLTGPLYLPQRTPQGYMMHHPMIGAPRSGFPTKLACSCCHTRALARSACQDDVLRWCAGEPPRLVAVPTHFFKAVLAETRGEGGAERALVGAWVLPNAPVRALPHNTGCLLSLLHVDGP